MKKILDYLFEKAKALGIIEITSRDKPPKRPSKILTFIGSIALFTIFLLAIWNQSDRAKQKALIKKCSEEPATIDCPDLQKNFLTAPKLESKDFTKDSNLIPKKKIENTD